MGLGDAGGGLAEGFRKDYPVASVQVKVKRISEPSRSQTKGREASTHAAMTQSTFWGVPTNWRVDVYKWCDGRPMRNGMENRQKRWMMSSSKQAAGLQWAAPERRKQGKVESDMHRGVGRRKDKEMVKRV
jgi:hypothetical protein